MGELPSLTRMLRRGDFVTTAGHVWLSTEPMDPQPPAVGVPAPIAEPIDGMHVREIEGDSLFGHFFSVDEPAPGARACARGLGAGGRRRYGLR